MSVYGRAHEKWGEVHVVALDELPRNASGKVIKGVLRGKDPA